MSKGEGKRVEAGMKKVKGIEIQTSSYKISQSQGHNVQHREYSK